MLGSCRQPGPKAKGMYVIITCVILLVGVAPRYTRFCYVNLRCCHALTVDSRIVVLANKCIAFQQRPLKVFS
jgi:hypothetical protein